MKTEKYQPDILRKKKKNNKRHTLAKWQRETKDEHVLYTLRCCFLFAHSLAVFFCSLSCHNWVRSLGMWICSAHKRTHTGLTIKCGCTINIYCLLLSFRAVFVVCSNSCWFVSFLLYVRAYCFASVFTWKLHFNCKLGYFSQ